MSKQVISVPIFNKKIEVRLKEKFPNTRGRINCTMAGNDNRWRWLGRQFIIN